MMLKKSLVMMTGSILFVIGMILFPLPVPFGLPVMIIALAILFKASYKVKRSVIRLTDKNTYTRNVWLKVREYQRRRKESLSQK